MKARNNYKELMMKAKKERAMQMLSMMEKGKTLQEVGDRYGVSRERVRQIVKPYKKSGVDYGASVKGSISKKTRKKQLHFSKTYHAFNRYGCSHSYYLWVKRFCTPTQHESPVGVYRQQKNNAKRRNIQWSLTLKEWWDIWYQSGKWEERGRGDGYVMARYKDIGPYQKDNVEIIRATKNIKDYYSEYSYEHTVKMLEGRSISGKITKINKEIAFLRRLARKTAIRKKHIIVIWKYACGKSYKEIASDTGYTYCHVWAIVNNKQAR